MTEFRRVKDAPTLEPPTLWVSWARLPVLWWRDVPVVAAERVELNELDRFVVEAASRLGHLDASAFAEFTGLPELVFTALGRRLHTLGLLRWRDGALMTTDHSASVLTEATVARRIIITLDFLYLPHTDDLLVVEDGLAEFEKAGPQLAGAAPLPSELHGATRRELLSSKIKDRSVVNLPPSVIELALTDEGDEPITAMAGVKPTPPVPVCPAMEGSATVVYDGDRPQVMLDVGQHQRRRGKANRSREAGVQVTLDISGATGLVSAWNRIAAKGGEPEYRAAAVGALASTLLDPDMLRARDPGRWWLAVTGPQAADLAKQCSLTRPIGLEVCDEHVHVVSTVQLTPADNAAKQLFALDSLIDQLLVQPAAVVDTVTAEQNTVDRVGGPHAVRRRAWMLGHRWMVHALREKQDFDYA